MDTIFSFGAGLHHAIISNASKLRLLYLIIPPPKGGRWAISHGCHWTIYQWCWFLPKYIWFLNVPGLMTHTQCFAIQLLHSNTYLTDVYYQIDIAAYSARWLCHIGYAIWLIIETSYLVDICTFLSNWCTSNIRSMWLIFWKCKQFLLLHTSVNYDRRNVQRKAKFCKSVSKYCTYHQTHLGPRPIFRIWQTFLLLKWISH